MRDANTSPRVLRGVVALIVLAVVAVTVVRYVSDYRASRADDAAAPSIEETATPEPQDSEEEPSGDTDEEPAAVPAPSGSEVVVVIDGLNFRTEPSAGASVIRGLGSGERLTLLETAGGWHRVRDSRQTEGYVSANPQYTRVE